MGHEANRNEAVAKCAIKLPVMFMPPRPSVCKRQKAIGPPHCAGRVPVRSIDPWSGAPMSIYSKAGKLFCMPL